MSKGTDRLPAVQHTELSSVLGDGLVGWDGERGWWEVQEGGDVCIRMADSLRGRN